MVFVVKMARTGTTWELVKKKINHQQLIAKRAEMTKKTAEKLGRRSKDDFKEGDKVVCQDMTTMRWTIKGEIVEGREAEDGSARSFIIRTDSGRTTIRNSHHIKFQAANRVSFSEDIVEFASDSDDESAEIGLETDSREPRRASARLAALTAH